MRLMQTTNDTPITETSMEAVIDRYLESFNETDAALRSELAHEVWAHDGRLVDPLIEAIGPEQIAAAIGALQDQMPGHALLRTTAIDVHHTHARFGWVVAAPDGTVAVAGIDVVTFAPDGRMQSAIGFFGDLAAAS